MTPERLSELQEKDTWDEDEGIEVGNALRGLMNEKQKWELDPAVQICNARAEVCHSLIWATTIVIVVTLVTGGIVGAIVFGDYFYYKDMFSR